MVSSAQSMVDIANKNLDIAKAQLLKSQNEEKDAAIKLDEVSKRLEVIDVDDVNNNAAVLNNGYVEEILVEGAGINEVNGRYIRHSLVVSSPYPSFSRSGEWQGKAVNFKIYHAGLTSWMISAGSTDFYVNNNSFNFLPTKDDWCTCNRGIPPEPELKY